MNIDEIEAVNAELRELEIDLQEFSSQFTVLDRMKARFLAKESVPSSNYCNEITLNTSMPCVLLRPRKALVSR